MKKKDVFITYELWCPVKNEPFYVGAGQHGRQYDHIVEAKSYRDKKRKQSTYNKHKLYKILKILKFNLEPIIKIVYTGNYILAYDLEITLIKKYGRADLGLGPLTNMTDGGEGGSLGYINSVETKRKKSIANQGSNNNMYGRTHTQFSRDQISKNHKNVAKSNNPMAKIWYITDPSGKDYIVHGNLIEFCEIYNLSAWTMAKMAKTNKGVSKGRCIRWSCQFKEKENEDLFR